MQNPIDNYWKIRIADLKNALERNNFEVFIAEKNDDAVKIILNEIIPAMKPKSISWGGSLSFINVGLYDVLKARSDMEVFDTYDRNISTEDALERRRQALLTDLFFTGTNAVTETGILVNLDMIGNRIGGLTFGPKHVIVLAGRNKIVPDLEDAMLRIKNYVAPVNAIRLEKKTPCAITGICEECLAPERICNTWTITEKSFPKGRVKVILINEDLGF